MRTTKWRETKSMTKRVLNTELPCSFPVKWGHITLRSHCCVHPQGSSPSSSFQRFSWRFDNPSMVDLIIDCVCGLESLVDLCGIPAPILTHLFVINIERSTKSHLLNINYQSPPWITKGLLSLRKVQRFENAPKELRTKPDDFLLLLL